MILVRISLLVILNVFTCVGSVAITDINWSGKNERVGYRYTCIGNETNLENCRKILPSLHAYWYNQRRGGVDCQHNDTKSKIWPNVNSNYFYNRFMP